MIKVNIVKEKKLEPFCEGIKKLNELFSEPMSRSTKRRIVMNITTYNYKDEISDACGRDLSDIIKIVPDADLPFGVLYIETSGIFNSMNMSKSGNIEVIRENTYSDLTKLNEEIILGHPEFLIMNKLTWSFLNEISEEDTDKYPTNGVAYYHSYHKVPVALCEFLSFGVITIV